VLASVSVFETSAELQLAEVWLAARRVSLTPPSDVVSGEVLVERGM
jgi:hypothetical protein